MGRIDNHSDIWDVLILCGALRVALSPPGKPRRVFAFPGIAMNLIVLLLILLVLCEAEGLCWDEASSPDKDRWGRTAGLVLMRLQDAGLA